MEGNRSEQAISRIETALSRIEAASAAFVPSNQHEALRSEVAATLNELDQLIKGLEP